MSNNCITGQTKEWEKKNSRWIIASFFGMGFAAFFYIGVKAKQKKWIIFSAIYAVIFSAILFINNYFSPNDETGGTIYFVYSSLSLIYFCCSIVHSFIVKKEYLLRLEAIQITGKDDLKIKIQKEYYGETSKNSSYLKQEASLQNDYKPTTKEDNSSNSSSKSENSTTKTIIDVNKCSESELEELPGISAVLSKKIISYRNANGSFKDEDEFFRIAALKPHFVVQLRGKICCSKIETHVTTSNPDRRLDF